jgi:hypothetical protein
MVLRPGEVKLSRASRALIPLDRTCAPQAHPNSSISGDLNVVKCCVRLIGLDPKVYGGHSLRAGMVTAAARYDRPKGFSLDPLAKEM